MPNAKRDDNRVTALVAVSSVDGVTIVPLYADPITNRLLVDSSGGGMSLLPATGTVNGSNTSFTFTQEPTYVVSDGVWLQQQDNNANNNWTWNNGTLTLTMVVPPQSAIWGFI